MRKRKLLVLAIFFLLMMSFLIACSSKNDQKDIDTLQEFTLEELSKYDGKDGRSAYIAVDGIVYDVTNVPQWKNGYHNGFNAGKDLSEEIKNQSPHGISKLKSIKIVGKLAD